VGRSTLIRSRSAAPQGIVVPIVKTPDVGDRETGILGLDRRPIEFVGGEVLDRVADRLAGAGKAPIRHRLLAPGMPGYREDLSGGIELKCFHLTDMGTERPIYIGAGTRNPGRDRGSEREQLFPCPSSSA
jgi:hypothetical protein